MRLLAAEPKRCSFLCVALPKMTDYHSAEHGSHCKHSQAT
jgi:hypothetical protein